MYLVIWFAENCLSYWSPFFFALRYEDLTLKPYDTVDKIFKFLSLRPEPEFIDKFIATHTGVTRLENKIHKNIEKRANFTDPYGTSRQSSKDTGKSFSEALILESVNPQYEERLLIDLQEKYKFRRYCVQILFWMSKQKTIFVHNMLWTCIFQGIQWTISRHIVG